MAFALALVLAAAASARLRGLLINTALLATGSLAVSLPAGLVLGVALGKLDVPGRRLLGWLLVGLLATPLYVVAAGWQTVLGSGGWLAHWFQRDGYAAPWLAGWRGALWVQGCAGVPWIALGAAASLRAVERKLEEESLLDAPPWRVVGRVSLPRAAGGVLIAVAWVVVVSASEIAVSDLYQVRTFAEEIYTQAALGPLLSWSAGGAALPGDPAANLAAPGGIGGGPGITAPSFGSSFLTHELLTGTLVAGLLVLATLVLAVGWLPLAANFAADAGWTWRPHGARRGLAAAAVWLTAALVVAPPIAGLAWKSGEQVVAAGDGSVRRQWSAVKAVRLTARSPYDNRREWGWSLATGALATAGAVALGLGGAWAVRARPRRGAAAIALVALVWATPAPLAAACLIAVLNQPPDAPLAALAWLYDRTLAAPVAVQMLRAAPLVTLWMWSQLTSVPDDLLEAARSEGAGPVARLVWVALPLRRWGVAAGVAAAFVLAVSEVSATMLVLPPGVVTIPVQVFQMLHYGVDDQVCALCLSIFGVVGAAIGAAACWTPRARRSETPRRVE